MRRARGAMARAKNSGNFHSNRLRADVGMSRSGGPQERLDAILLPNGHRASGRTDEHRVAGSRLPPDRIPVTAP